MALSRSKIKKQLEPLVKDYVKRRDNYTCQHCGKVCSGSDCHASHILNVGGHSNLEFDPRNMKVLCMHCHLYWWHKDPLESGQWYRDNFPDNWDYLQREDKKRDKISTVRLAELINEYKEFMNE